MEAWKSCMIFGEDLLNIPFCLWKVLNGGMCIDLCHFLSNPRMEKMFANKKGFLRYIGYPNFTKSHIMHVS